MIACPATARLGAAAAPIDASIFSDTAQLIRIAAIRAEERTKGVLIGTAIGVVGSGVLLFFFGPEIASVLPFLAVRRKNPGKRRRAGWVLRVYERSALGKWKVIRGLTQYADHEAGRILLQHDAERYRSRGRRADVRRR